MISRNNILNSIIIWVTVILSFIVIIITDSAWLHIMVFWISALVPVIIKKIDITHPIVWVSVSFALYSTGYTIIYLLEYPVQGGYTKENMLYHLTALTVLVLTMGVKSESENLSWNEQSRWLASKNFNIKIVELIIITLTGILFLSVMILSKGSYAKKNEIMANEYSPFIIGSYSGRFLCFYLSYYMLLIKKNMQIKSKIIILSASVLIVMYSLLTGERDAMFRLAVISIVTMYITRRVSKKMLLFIMPISIIVMTASVYYKYYFVTGVVNESIKEYSLLVNFLNTDFSAAGNNLQVLINNPWTKSYYGLKLILIDIIAPFLVGIKTINVGVWFNDIFYANSYSRAFTLVGEGYVAFGVIGVIIIFFILGLIIRFIYRKSRHNILWLATYIYSVPTVISSFRSTLGTVSIALVRIALLSVVILICINAIFLTRKRRKIWNFQNNKYEIKD